MMGNNVNDYGSIYLIRDQKIKSSIREERLRWIIRTAFTIILLLAIAILLFYMITLWNLEGDDTQDANSQKSTGIIKTTNNSVVSKSVQQIVTEKPDILPSTRDSRKFVSIMETTTISSKVTGATPVSTMIPKNTISTVTGTTPFSTILTISTSSTVTGTTPVSTMVPTSTTSIVTGTITTSTAVPTTDLLTALCDVKIKPLGCYADNPSNHSMDMMLDSHRGQNSYYHGVLTDWNKFGHSLKLLLCDCVNRAKEKGMNYIGMQFYGECWGSKVPTYNKYGSSTRCVDSKFKACYNKNNQDICVGEKITNYVYEIL